MSELLSVSLDRLLKRNSRELKTGYIGKDIYLYDFDYKGSIKLIGVKK